MASHVRQAGEAASGQGGGARRRHELRPCARVRVGGAALRQGGGARPLDSPSRSAHCPAPPPPPATHTHLVVLFAGMVQTSSSSQSHHFLHLLGSAKSLPSKHSPISTVWVDVGTASRSDLFTAFSMHADVKFIGIEPVRDFARASGDWILRHAEEARATMIEAACAPGRSQNVTFLIHAERECSTLLPSQSSHQRVGKNGACVGMAARPTKVYTVSLESVLMQHTAPELRIELLKVDVQGSELPCVLSAGNELSRVDNIFLEVQDVPHHQLMYESAHNLGNVDRVLENHKFLLQYCEENFGISVGPSIRELNCLWTRDGKKPIWVTGQSTRGPAGVNVGRNISRRPPFKPRFGYVTHYVSANRSGGAMMQLLSKFGLVHVL